MNLGRIDLNEFVASCRHILVDPSLLCEVNESIPREGKIGIVGLLLLDVWNRSYIVGRKPTPGLPMARERYSVGPSGKIAESYSCSQLFGCLSLTKNA